MSSSFVPINLLRIQSVLTSDELILLTRLRLIAVVVTIFLLIIGTGVGALYWGGAMRLKAIEADRNIVLRQLAENAEKQILLMSIKDKVPSVEKIIRAQYPWQQLISTMMGLVSPPKLRSVRIDQSNVLQLNIKADSIDEIQQITAKIIELTNEKRLRHPQIDSLQVGKEGVVTVISVYPL